MANMRSFTYVLDITSHDPTTKPAYAIIIACQLSETQNTALPHHTDCRRFDCNSRPNVFG